MDRSETLLRNSTDCHCASCRRGIAKFADPQTRRSCVRAPEPELCSSCYARILEGRASSAALDLHAVLSEIGAVDPALSGPTANVLASIEAWLELPPTSNEEPDNVITGRF